MAKTVATLLGGGHFVPQYFVFPPDLTETKKSRHFPVQKVIKTVDFLRILVPLQKASPLPRPKKKMMLVLRQTNYDEVFASSKDPPAPLLPSPQLLLPSI